MSDSPCLHVITSSPKRCDHCGQQLPAEAQLAARLRGRYAVEGTTAATAPLILPNHGETTLTLVLGDEVASLTVLVRPRVDADRAECRSDFVAEVTKGCRIGDWEYRLGDVFDVKVGVEVGDEVAAATAATSATTERRDDVDEAIAASDAN